MSPRAVILNLIDCLEAVPVETPGWGVRVQRIHEAREALRGMPAIHSPSLSPLGVTILERRITPGAAIRGAYVGHPDFTENSDGSFSLKSDIEPSAS